MRLPTEAMVFEAYWEGPGTTEYYELIGPHRPCDCSDQCGAITMPQMRNVMTGKEVNSIWLTWTKPLTKAAREQLDYEISCK